MRILILGSRGYIAGQTAEIMTSIGWEVIRVARGRDEGLSNGSPDSSETFFEEPEEIAAILEKTNPDAVVNLSNFFTTTDTHEDIDKLIGVNCTLVGHLAKICSEHGVPIVHVASAWQNRFSEQDSQVGTIYSLYKDLASEILEWYCKNFALRAIQMVLHDTYGPSDPRGKIVTKLIDHVGKETSLPLSGGRQLLELVHVQDVAKAVMACAVRINKNSHESPSRRLMETFWCLPTAPVSLKDLVSILDSVASKPILVSWGLREYRPGEKFSSLSRVNKELVPGWKPTIDLRIGLADIIDGSKGPRV
jgi:nucleoside-diphosphate-sugar epimerase